MPQTQTARTWYGLPAHVTIGPGFLHRAGFGRVKIPHPPLANWLLRQGLPAEVKLWLSFAHEFAHFQTAPAALAYLIVLLLVARRSDVSGVAEWFFLLASVQAFWEMLSECLVVVRHASAYHLLYKGASIFPRVFFWVSAIVLAVVQWAVVMLNTS